MASPVLSVSELAAACAPVDAIGEFDANRLRLWTRRLRHWTVLGILPTTGRHAEGPGKHRLYNADLVYPSAVLLRIAGIGLPFPVIKLIADDLMEEIADSRRLAGFWHEAVESHGAQDAYFLAIWIADEGEYTWVEGVKGTARKLDLANIDMQTEPTLILNLSEIFTRVREFVG
jgi:DNA-binding transcriptional MerR regulator